MKQSTRDMSTFAIFHEKNCGHIEKSWDKMFAFSLFERDSSIKNASLITRQYKSAWANMLSPYLFLTHASFFSRELWGFSFPIHRTRV